MNQLFKNMAKFTAYVYLILFLMIIGLFAMIHLLAGVLTS